MNKAIKENFAYIDAANLHKGIKNLNWRLDYRRFRIWLTEKYSVSTAYLNDQRSILEPQKEKAPDEDETS